MTPEQKEAIYKLRLQGMGYKAIAQALLLTVNVVKGYCNRNQLNVETVKECLQCGKLVRQKKRGRTKKFCSDACRYTWWNENQNERNKKAATYHYTCLHCKQEFVAYGNKHRKYCSHDCYIKFRFWGEEDGI